MKLIKELEKELTAHDKKREEILNNIASAKRRLNDDHNITKQYVVMILCPECDGSCYPGEDDAPCPRCGSDGEIKALKAHVRDLVSTERDSIIAAFKRAHGSLS